jgi:Ni/Fe-hydrogenase subunit HybB-like protein
MIEHAEPVGGRLFTRPVKVLAVLAGVAGVLVLIRLIFGIGAVTALSDGYPWGLWIAFDVVTGTALACGGYAVALLVYIMNKGRYHPLVRPAILTSALGYTLAGFGVMLDVGRWWGVWRVPLFFWEWNLSSVLLEVALCIMAYVVVLWIELSPAFLERARHASSARVREVADRGLKLVNRSLLWIVALGILLPTMHQSSLGSLMLLAGPRLHPLWNTGWLPLLFLISCVAMGYAVVVFEAALSSMLLRRKPEIEMLAGIARVMVPIILLYPALRIVDLAFAGRLPLLFSFDVFSTMALLELALAIAPGIMLMNGRKRRNLGHLFRASVLMILAGGLYRFDTYLVAFRPGDNWAYFPSVPEMFTTFGLIAAEILAYIVIIKFFPILAGAPDSTGKAGTAWART